MSADLSIKKNVDQSQQTSRSGKCTLDLEKFRSWLSSRKDQKGLMKGANYSVNSQTFAIEATFTISLKKLPRRLNLLKGSRLSYKTIKCEKKFCLLFSFKVTLPLHHPKNNFMSKWHLIQRNYKKPTLISLILVRSKNLWSRITLYRACTYVFGLSTVWLQQRRLHLR